METQLAEKDQVKEVNDEEQGLNSEEIMEVKKSNFEAQDPLVEVNLGTEGELRMTKVSDLLPEDNRDQVLQLIKKTETILVGIIMRCQGCHES